MGANFFIYTGQCLEVKILDSMSITYLVYIFGSRLNVFPHLFGTRLKGIRPCSLSNIESFVGSLVPNVDEWCQRIVGTDGMDQRCKFAAYGQRYSIRSAKDRCRGKGRMNGRNSSLDKWNVSYTRNGGVFRHSLRLEATSETYCSRVPRIYILYWSSFTCFCFLARSIFPKIASVIRYCACFIVSPDRISLPGR